MKVLVVFDVLGEENNGTTIAGMNLVRYLRSQGETVEILCADQDKKGLPGYHVVPNLYLGFFINNMLKHNQVTLACPKKKIIEEALKGVDIVHVMMPFALGVATCKIAKKKGIPVTAGFHVQAENFTSHIFNTMDSKFINNKVYHSFYKKLYSKINAIHYPTEFIRKTFEDTIKIKTNGYVISNGVSDQYVKKEVTRIGEYAKHFNILFIGRISKEKSHEVLVRAIAQSKYKDNIQLIFAGQGPKEKKIQKLANNLGLIKPIIKFFKREDLVNVINQSDLYVHPAEVEIESIACLEAITCGLVPIVANSPKCATKYFALSDKNLFKNKDSKDLAAKIDYWIEHPEEKAKCSEEYLGFTTKFKQHECMVSMHNMLKTYSKPENHTTHNTIYYRDPINDDFANNGIIPKPTPSNWKYLHKNPIYNASSFVLYNMFAKPVVYLLNKIVYKQKIINHLSVKKKDIKGCFVYANHTMDMGDAFTPNIIFRQKNHIIVDPAATSIPGIRTLVSMFGALPIPGKDLNLILRFKDSIKTIVDRGQIVTIYPEAHIWPYYTGIRNFSSSSFIYPVETRKPVICITNTFLPRGKKGFRLVSHIDGPFYPDITVDKKTSKEKLRDQVYETMIKRSTQNKQFEHYKYFDLTKIEVTKN